MRGEAVTQCVGMGAFLDARPLGGFLTCIPNRFRIDGLITVMAVVAWKQPGAGFSSQTVPMCTQFLKQFCAEHHIAISASLAALNVNHHALAVDVADFQMRQLGVAHSGGVERHQQNAMVGSERSIDESCDFFLAQDRRKVKCSFRVGSLGDAPGFLGGLGIEKPERRQMLRNGARRQLPLLKQLGLVFANVSRPQAVRRTVESSSKIFDCVDVMAYGIFRKVTTPGVPPASVCVNGSQGWPPCDPNLSQPSGNHRSFTSRAASAARAALFKRRNRPCGSRYSEDSGSVDDRTVACRRQNLYNCTVTARRLAASNYLCVVLR